MNKYYTVNFAQAYGQSAYGNCVYNDTTSCQTSGGGTGTGSGAGSSSGNNSGGLANTGIMVIAFVTLACLIMFIALVVRLWRRPSKKLQPNRLLRRVQKTTLVSSKPEHLVDGQVG